ncbi:MAG: universal stress protein [Alphaproteobacteria bacterium]|nr:universal stress protein [Alphaproteobacteria bacterium]
MAEKKTRRRQSDGGTYLIIADDTPEFTVALNYAAHMARIHRGHVAMARIIEPSSFVGWGNIEKAAKEEARAQAEAEMQAKATRVKEETGITPSFIIREGDTHSEIIAIANGNPCLSAIVLAASTSKGKPGPLVAYFTAKGLTEISVPVIIVPGHLNMDDLRKLH